ncbi:TIGR01777 family oxidoreductase [Terracoccus sp. 273MFTsu3.1]|uniref:TIGR01777 family oxidoreductase n=1 Tax=Terracoccus sp. 273MFTsu3.1 TaxID=1172188 RepID=UPI000364FC4E|nr:TIGR01777 family oxidoreductase [Terracoccus sp. 273MFTsu3.1]
MTKRVAVTGSSGLIGGALRRALAERGDEVVRLVRHAPSAPDEVQWDPSRGRLADGALDGVDAVVNLAGVGIGDRRWNAEHKREVERSRTDATGTVAQALVAHRDRTGETVRLVNASAVGYYGDRGEEHLPETSEPGQDFLSGVVVRWEGAAEPAVQAGLPVAFARTGLVMAPQGGAFEQVVLLGRLGLGGPMGSGREWWPWITLVDEVRAILHLVDRPELVGPFNLVAPGVARQAEIASAIGSALSRPAFVPAPRFALRAVIGEFADYVVASQRVEPQALLAAGFTFEHPDLDGAVRWLVKR